MHTEHLTIDKLPCTLWLPDGSPGAMLQIIHGMTEHTGRYEAFAAFLTAHGIAVAGFDLRGHGKTAATLRLPPSEKGAGKKVWRISIASALHCKTAIPLSPTSCWAFLWAPSCCGNIWPSTAKDCAVPSLWEQDTSPLPYSASSWQL